MTARNVHGRRPRKNPATFLGAATIVVTLTMTVSPAAEQCVPGAINWIDQFGTADSDEANGVAVDGTGSSYVTGTTAGALPGQISGGGVDAFVRKYDSAHNEVWTRQFGTSGDDRAFDVALDAIGNVYISGSLASPVTRAFLRKYDAAGTEVWTREFGSPFADARSVAVDPTGSVYVGGVVFAALPGQISAGGFDAFVRKYSDAGGLVWTRQFGTPGNDHAAGVAVGTDGNVRVTGVVDGALPGQSSSGGNDIFARQYDASGSVMWTHEFGTAGDDTATTVAVDESGNTYIAGGVAGALPGESWQGGTFDAFIRKYDVAGGEAWTRQFGTPPGCAGCFGFDLAWGVAVDDVGNAYVTGTVGGPLPGKTFLGGGDAFVRQYDSAGNEGFTEQFGSSFSEDGHDLASDRGSVYLAGVTFGVLEAGNPGLNWDAFVMNVFTRDAEPPSLSLTMSPGKLWPPDHRMIPIDASVSVSDGCDANPTVTLLSLTSNEPDNGDEDGDTIGDIQIVDPYAFLLRAERSSLGTGRIYTATYVATDASGNASDPISATVVVPLANK